MGLSVLLERCWRKQEQIYVDGVNDSGYRELDLTNYRVGIDAVQIDDIRIHDDTVAPRISFSAGKSTDSSHLIEERAYACVEVRVSVLVVVLEKNLQSGVPDSLLNSVAQEAGAEVLQCIVGTKRLIPQGAVTEAGESLTRNLQEWVEANTLVVVLNNIQILSYKIYKS